MIYFIKILKYLNTNILKGKIIQVLVVTLIGSSMLFASVDKMKKYEIKSGKIVYDISTSGNVMGMVKIEMKGTKKVTFNDNGLNELVEEHKVTKEVAMGQAKEDKSHTIQYMKDDFIYSVDFKMKKITRIKNPAMDMMKMFGDKKSMKKTAEEMMKSMGGKKTGTDKVLGYTCEVWEMMGVTQCIYKGIPLRIKSNIMGMKNMDIATKADFDISLNKDDFALPDFPISDMQVGLPGGEMGMDSGMRQAPSSPEDMEKAMKAMGAMMGALNESGMDMSKLNFNMSEDKSEDKSEAMQKAMMNAMGGEKTILEQTKREIFEDAKMIPQAKKCFKKASSAKEANACERQIDSNDPEHHDQWNDAIKTSLLKEINAFEDAIPCMKSAKTLNALKMCMPQD